MLKYVKNQILTLGTYKYMSNTMNSFSEIKPNRAVLK